MDSQQTLKLKRTQQVLTIEPELTTQSKVLRINAVDMLSILQKIDRGKHRRDHFEES